MIFLKLPLIALVIGLATTSFGATATGATKSTEAASNLMKERAEALKDVGDSKGLFEAKEINLDKAGSTQEKASTAATTIESQSLKESEVPIRLDATKDKAPEKTSLARVLISLVVVFSLLGGSIFALKNWSKKREVQSGGMKIRVLTQHHLGPKKSLAIIQVAGESILVGITDQNISMLKTLALIDDEIPAGQPNKFDDALYNYEEEAGEIGKHFATTKNRAANEAVEPDEFALRGISEIRDVVSRRLKGMRQIE